MTTDYRYRMQAPSRVSWDPGSYGSADRTTSACELPLPLTRAAEQAARSLTYPVEKQEEAKSERAALEVPTTVP